MQIGRPIPELVVTTENVASCKTGLGGTEFGPGAGLAS